MLKKVNRYEIRYWPKEPALALSEPLGRKLRSYARARKLVRRLKSRGYEAFTIKYRIPVMGMRNFEK